MLVKFEGVELDVHQNNEHEWLLETSLVAKGYEVDKNLVIQALGRRKDDLIEGKHYIKGGDNSLPPSRKNNQPNQIFWTKKGVVRLGFILRCEKAKLFRDWAEDLIIEKQNYTKVVLEKYNEFAQVLVEENEKLKEKLNHYEKQLVSEGFKMPLFAEEDAYNPLNISEYYTVKDYLTRNNRYVNLDSIIKISHDAKQISEEEGYHVMFKPNSKYGKINYYHSSVIRSAYYRLTDDWI